MSNYDYDLLAHYVSTWWNAELAKRWSSNGHSGCAPIHRQATSNRQYDSSSGVLDDALDKMTNDVIDTAMQSMTPPHRAILMQTHCAGPHGNWVSLIVSSIPEKDRPSVLSDAMDALAVKVMAAGVTL